MCFQDICEGQLENTQLRHHTSHVRFEVFHGIFLGFDCVCSLHCRMFWSLHIWLLLEELQYICCSHWALRVISGSCDWFTFPSFYFSPSIVGLLYALFALPLFNLKIAMIAAALVLILITDRGLRMHTWIAIAFCLVGRSWKQHVCVLTSCFLLESPQLPYTGFRSVMKQTGKKCPLKKNEEGQRRHF